MIRDEVSIGMENPQHLQKGVELINSLTTWTQRNPFALEEDVNAAQAIIGDLRDALSYTLYHLQE